MADLRVAVWGARGRMGQAVISAIGDTKGYLLWSAVDRPESPHIGKPVAGPREHQHDVILKKATDELPGDTDILIDFSTPEGTLSALAYAKSHTLPLVSGTTGLNAEQMAALKEAAQFVPVFYSPNMSYGLNACLEVLRQLAAMLPPEFDVEIVDVHHRQKQDAPSGTALRIAEVIQAAREKDAPAPIKVGRERGVDPRKGSEITIHALRAGQVIGRHEVGFYGPTETIHLIHNVQDRGLFAKGALRVAEFLMLQPPGFYTFRDMFQQRVSLRIGTPGTPQ